MRKCAIHQPHYFPWLGYLNKMMSVDTFILLDEVQIEKGSNMYRNKLSTLDGKEKYITLPYEKKGSLNKKFKDIKLDNTILWQERQYNFIENNYKKTPYFKEIMPYIEKIFYKKYERLCEVIIESILIEKEIFNIDTKIICQSELSYDQNNKKNELLIDLCKAAKVDEYLSGNGAKKYMNEEVFLENGIGVKYQSFNYPKYKQQHEFVPNLSGLDILFNLGIDESRKVLKGSILDD